MTGCPGASVGKAENLTGVLEATVRDPSGQGPGARLIGGLKSQGATGVGGQPAPIFTPARRLPQETWGLDTNSLAVNRWVRA